LRQYLSLENDCIFIKQIQDKAIEIIDEKMVFQNSQGKIQRC
jgi:hypothetical protein